MLNPSAISIIQVLTAVGALFVAGWSFLTARRMAELQREHNYRSFLPIAYLRLGNFKSGFSIELSNEGVGPLIIRNVTIIDPEKGTSATNFIPLLEPETPPVLWDKYAQRLSGRTIPPQKSITLLSLFDEKRTGDPAYDQAFAAFRFNAQSRLTKMLFKLEYQDIYGRRFQLQQTLDWMSPSNAGIPDRGTLELSRDELGSDVPPISQAEAKPASKPKNSGKP